MQYLKEIGTGGRPISAKQVDEVSPGTTFRYAPPVGGITGIRHVRDFVFDNYRRTVAFSCTHKVEQSVRDMSHLDHVMDGIGSEKVFEALWDLVPFSFVMDWFFHIDRLMVVNPLLWGGDKVTMMGSSIKQEWKFCTAVAVQIDPLWLPDVYHSGQFVTGSPEILRKSYYRYPGFPSGTSESGAWGGLSKTQLASGAALMLQRI
jgi:hypothetical protein